MKKVPFYDYPQAYLRNRELYLSIIDDVCSRGAFIMQKEVEEFEQRLAAYTKSDFAVGVGNATDGLELALMSLKLSPGDEVICCSHTMLATASAIVVAGGTPVPVEVGYDNLIDYESIKQAITTRTVGIVPTQLNGRTCNMDIISKIASDNDLFVVEDSAQALGSTFKGKSAGTFGIAGAFSFFPAKVLGSFGDAGGVVCSDPVLYEQIYQLHDHGRDSRGAVRTWGRNSRLDNVQAAILLSKLPSYPDEIKRRRSVAEIYQSRLKDIEEVVLPPGPDHDSDHFDIFQNYEIRASRRDHLKLFLEAKGIGTILQWGGKGIHQWPHVDFQGYLPVTDKFFKECLLLPMNTFLSDDDIHYVCDNVRSFYRS